MKRGRRHGRLPHSRARAVAGGSNVSAAAVPPTPKAGCGQQGIRVRLAGSARNGAARWAEKRWLCWGLSVERGQCGRWGGEGGKGGEGGAATEHYSSLSFQKELLVVGGKEHSG